MLLSSVRADGLDNILASSRADSLESRIKVAKQAAESFHAHEISPVRRKLIATFENWFMVIEDSGTVWKYRFDGRRISRREIHPESGCRAVAVNFDKIEGTLLKVNAAPMRRAVARAFSNV